MHIIIKPFIIIRHPPHSLILITAKKKEASITRQIAPLDLISIMVSVLSLSRMHFIKVMSV